MQILDFGLLGHATGLCGHTKKALSKERLSTYYGLGFICGSKELSQKLMVTGNLSQNLSEHSSSTLNFWPLAEGKREGSDWVGGGGEGVEDFRATRKQDSYATAL